MKISRRKHISCFPDKECRRFQILQGHIVRSRNKAKFRCPNNYSSLTAKTNGRNVSLYNPYRQYTSLFIFRFVCEQCLRSKRYILLSISAVHQPFHISICIWTMPSLETLDFTFYIGSTPTFLYFDLYLNTAYAQNVRLYFLYRQYTNLFIFWFVSEHCLRSKR